MHFRKLKLGPDNGDKIKGKGKDEVGKFKIKGHFNAHTGEVRFEKKYKGKHSVDYKGHFRGSDVVGQWSVSGVTGNFHLTHDYDAKSDSSSSDSD